MFVDPFTSQLRGLAAKHHPFPVDPKKIPPTGHQKGMSLQDNSPQKITNFTSNWKGFVQERVPCRRGRVIVRKTPWERGGATRSVVWIGRELAIKSRALSRHSPVGKVIYGRFQSTRNNWFALKDQVPHETSRLLRLRVSTLQWLVSLLNEKAPELMP